MSNTENLGKSKRPYRELGTQLKTLRERLQIPTQRQLLDDLVPYGVIYDNSFWSLCESGRRRPDRTEFVKILKFLHDRGILPRLTDANHLLQVGKYHSLEEHEIQEIFGNLRLADKTSSPADDRQHIWPQDDASAGPSPHSIRQRIPHGKRFRSQRFDFLVIGLWFIFAEALELWHNAFGQFTQLVDTKWIGLTVPLIAAALLVALFWRIHLPILRSILLLFASLGVGLVLAGFIHPFGIIRPVLHTIGGFLLGVLLFTQGPVFLLPRLGPPWPFTRDWQLETAPVSPADQERELVRLCLQFMVWLWSSLTLLAVFMGLILFAAPLGNFGEQGYEVRVMSGIEIMLAYILWALYSATWVMRPIVQLLTLPNQPNE